MAISFLLKNATLKRSSIEANIHFRGKRYKKLTGASVLVSVWNKRTQRCRIVASEPLAEAINEKIDYWEKAAKETIKVLTATEEVPDISTFWNLFHQILTGGQPVHHNPSFTEYMASYIDKIQDNSQRSTLFRFRKTLEILNEFEQKYYHRQLKFEDIDMNFYRRFRKYCDDLDYSENSFGSFIKTIKTVFREARVVDKLHNETGIEHRDFKTVSATADAIYLTEEELMQIYHLQITPEKIAETLPKADLRGHNIERKISACELVRGRWLIGAFTGLRVSDFGRLGEINIDGDFIRVRTKKTDKPTVIPIHWVVRELLNAGFDLTTQISDQKINKHIKEIARMAGIDSDIEITQVKGGEIIRTVYKKWELVCTHTARRSFATNAYKAGIHTIAIMKITGHTRETTFLKYIRVSEEENAEALSTHAFFRKKQE